MRFILKRLWCVLVHRWEFINRDLCWCVKCEEFRDQDFLIEKSDL